MNKSEWFTIKKCLEIQDLFLKKVGKKNLKKSDKELLKKFCSLSKYNDIGSGIIEFFDTLKLLVDNEYLEITNGKF
jgi:hypothetical protein